MLKGFKDFLMRGNVVELAVGIAIGVAFTTLVGAIGTNFINPIIAAVGGNSSNGFGFKITDNPKTLVDIGGILNALIVFVVTMAVIYFAIVVPMGKIQARMNANKAPEEAAISEDTELLRQIRDSLANRG